MLIWDEKVKPALPLQTARGSRSQRLDKPPLTKSKTTLSTSTSARRVKATTKQRVINNKTNVTQLQRQNPQRWTAEFKVEIRALFEATGELETRYVKDTVPRDMLDMNASMYRDCLRHIANRRATPIGLDVLHPNEDHPFPWLNDMMALKKERNVFETRVMAYQSGALSGTGTNMMTRISQVTTVPQWEPGDLCTRVHDAGISPNTMNHFMHSNSHEVLFVN